MNFQLPNLIRILLNPKITSTPVRVLKELRARGKQRVPGTVQAELESGIRGRHTLRFVREWLDGEVLSRHDGKWVLNSFLPPFPGKSFDRMFENLLSGRRLSPVSAYLAVTAFCPYSCWHCSFKNRRNGELSTDAWLSIVSGLHGIGASIVGFTGGEPLAREDLPELVEAAVTGGASSVVFTSGALMNREKVRRLKQAGLWAFCISLDHPNPADFDRLRGAEGAFDRAVKAIRISLEAGFYTMIGTVATRNLLDENLQEDIYKIARETGVHEFRLIEPMPCGMLAGTEKNNLLTADHIGKLRKFHVTTNRKGRLPKVCAFNHIESPEIFGCGAGTQHMFVDSAGEVCPCDFTPMSFGNAVFEPIETIWHRMNDAMGNPGRHCFIQKNHRLISAHAESGYPLPPDVSEKICAQAGRESLPDFFALVTGQTKRNS